MVVCKYFQQGSCRFGQSCRFEHIYGSKYSYTANAPTTAPAAPTATQSGVTDEQLVTQVQSDVQAAIKGKQWMLSVYAPFKEKPIYPGLSDLSPEEARLFIYEAKANNTLPQAAAFFTNLMQEARANYEQLLHPTPELIKVLRSLHQGISPQTPFSNAQQTNSGFSSTNNGSASSIFRSAAQSNSIFASGSNVQPSIFAAQPATNNAFNTAKTENTSAKSIFAQATQNVFGNTQQNSNATSIFASANQSIFGTSSNKPFGQPQATPFANTAMQQSGNVFQKQEMQSQNIFAQTNASISDSVFGPKPAQASTNIFGQSTPSDVFKQPTSNSIFGQASSSIEQQVGGNDRGVYSQLEDLTPEDIEAFQSPDFKLGFIPEIPPTHAFCV